MAGSAWLLRDASTLVSRGREHTSIGGARRACRTVFGSYWAAGTARSFRRTSAGLAISGNAISVSVAAIVRLALVLIMIRATVGVVSGSASTYLATEIGIDALLASIVLGSLATQRPFAYQEGSTLARGRRLIRQLLVRRPDRTRRARRPGDEP